MDEKEDRDYCMIYSSGNTKTMVGKKNSLLTKIKNAPQCVRSIFGCTCHLTNLCVEKGPNELSLNIKDMIRSYIISREVSRENLHCVYIIEHVSIRSIRWLSLGKCLDRTLTQWDALKFYFVSNFDLNDDDEENDNTNSREER